MAKERKKNETTLEDWLLNFERQVGTGVIVSLLIENGRVEFVSCVDRKRYLEPEKDDGTDDDGGIQLQRRKPDLRLLNNYIG